MNTPHRAKATAGFGPSHASRGQPPRRRIPGLHAIAALGCGLLLSACQPRNDAAAPLKTHASLQELMHLIDASADPLWESVSTTITQAGIEEHQPRTDAEWKEVRLHALRLVELSNLLQLTRRPITHPGLKLEDDHVEGIFKPEDVRAAIDRNPAAFAQAAQALTQASLDNLRAIDARDVAKIIQAGETLDKACESCHAVYWYPNDKTPWSASTKTSAAAATATASSSTATQ